MQPHIRAFVERAVTFTDLPRVRRHPAQRGGPVVEDRRHQHRRRLRDADQRPRRLGARPRRAVGGAAARGAAAHLDSFVEIGLGYLSLDRPVGHAVRRRGAAHQDDPPPRLLAHRRHLRLRRADDRAAPARHPADERPAAAAARQGQHRAGRGAQAGGDRDRRPRRRPRPRRRHRRRRGRASRAPSTGCGPAARSPAATSTTGPPSRRRCGRPPARWRSAAPTTHNLQDVDVDIPLGVLVVRHRRRRLGQELADPRLGRRPATGVVSIDQGAIRGSRRSNPATYTGLLDPIRKAFAKANGVKPALFSANSEGACPNCNGAGVIYTDLGDDGRRRHHLRGVRGQAVPGLGAGVHASAAATSARCSRCR